MCATSLYSVVYRGLHQLHYSILNHPATLKTTALQLQFDTESQYQIKSWLFKKSNSKCGTPCVPTNRLFNKKTYLNIYTFPLYVS